eukprot:CAMPEP_0173418564 /NCGR_PEP_ID=MMETSP1357-20121228/669_1 /TAXON_ID=77926 /ORGANISM="Hemiselmis rufescens, Strain PCC563" /LENGTH=175 /DNA_ID=CAMNT_0014381071 /DNA_START=79 /DNA_END=606 /DNA_ORIENTATION=+
MYNHVQSFDNLDATSRLAAALEEAERAAERLGDAGLDLAAGALVLQEEVPGRLPEAQHLALDVARLERLLAEGALDIRHLLRGSRRPLVGAHLLLHLVCLQKAHVVLQEAPVPHLGKVLVARLGVPGAPGEARLAPAVAGAPRGGAEAHLESLVLVGAHSSFHSSWWVCFLSART